jgi:hypothetical protein
MPDREDVQREAQDQGVNPPSGVGEDALRWGSFIVQHLDPEPGSILFLKAPKGEKNDEKLDEMADSIRAVLEEAGIEPVSIILGTPQLSISKLSKDQLNRFGYVYDPSARADVLKNMETK